MDKQLNAAEGKTNLINRLSRKGTQVLTAVAADDLPAISARSQKEVERLVADAYRRRGYQVVELGGPAAPSDAGMLLSKAAQRLLLQCKYWKTRKLAEMPVRELYGMMAAQGANGGMLITSGTFTLEASRFAGYGHIQLIDVPRLLALLRASAEPCPEEPPRADAAAR
jgi:restriction system protein